MTDTHMTTADGAGLRALLDLADAFTKVTEARYHALAREISGKEPTMKFVNKVVAEVESAYRRNKRWFEDAAHVVIGQFDSSVTLAEALRHEVDAPAWSGAFPMPPYDPVEKDVIGSPGQYLASVMFVIEQAPRDWGIKRGNIEAILNKAAATPA